MGFWEVGLLGSSLGHKGMSLEPTVRFWPMLYIAVLAHVVRDFSLFCPPHYCCPVPSSAVCGKGRWLTLKSDLQNARPNKYFLFINELPKVFHCSNSNMCASCVHMCLYDRYILKYMYVSYAFIVIMSNTNIYNRLYPSFLLTKCLSSWVLIRRSEQEDGCTGEREPSFLFLERKGVSGICASGYCASCNKRVCPVHINYYYLGSNEAEKTGQALHLIQQSQMERTCLQWLSLILTPQEIP